MNITAPASTVSARASCPALPWCLLLLLAGAGLAGCAGVPTGRGTPDAFPTSDVEPVTLKCGAAAFIVSLNDDDDNDNNRADLRQAVAPATEDNIREFIFSHPTADAVYVADIIILATHQTAVGTRVRAYKQDLRTAFAFNTTHPTSAAAPLKLCLEGILTSGLLNDIGFEYQFYQNGKPLPCGGFVTGTVVDVNAKLAVAQGRGTAFARNRKLLITAAGNATGTVAPAGAGRTEWTYDVPANVTLATPALLATAVTAGATVTAVANRDRDQLRLNVHATGHRIEAHFPINVTSPQHTVVTNGNNGFNITTGWLDANQGQFSLVPVYRINYRLLDQFRNPIKDSAYGTRTPQIRENIGTVMTSPVPPVQAWIANGLQWSPNWTDHPDGTFTDRIEATDVNKDLVVVPFPGFPGRRMFAANLQAVGGVLLNLTGPHVWELSVNGAGVANGTANTFSSTVVNTRPRGGGIQIQLRSTYRVVPQ